MANPTKLAWEGPTKYTDGSAFGAADFAGFEISVNGQPAVALPVQWQTTNQYEFDIAALGLSFGTHAVNLRTVAVNGQRSDPSATVTFQLADERRPFPPTNLRVV